jgi:TPP-dependent pyruvate/acetoin dehydrogenase alpha subunit
MPWQRAGSQRGPAGHLSHIGTELRDSFGVGDPEALKMYGELHFLRTLLDRQVEVFKEGLIPGALYPGNGHEAIQVGPFHTLRPTDWISPSHRGAQCWLWLRPLL